MCLGGLSHDLHMKNEFIIVSPLGEVEGGGGGN